MRSSAPLRARAGCLLPLLLAAVLLGDAGRAALAAASPDADLPLPDTLRPAVSFWIDIYSRHTTDHTVLHDRERLDIVYGILDFSEPARASTSDAHRARARANTEELEKERIRALLREIALKADRPERLTAEERRIYDRFPPDGPRVTGARFLDAAERVRAQVGQRDRFIEAIRISGRYLPEMEQIFTREGVPVELTRLAFVESMFNMGARSSAGAAGVWQFIRSTGRRYLRIDGLVDERYDPLLAAVGAARLLADNYAALGTWPLAVTAYNHGKYGMLRAVAEIGSRDIDRIVVEYQGPGFAFASRNFYAEFLAALHVERHARRYFGPITRETPPEYVLVSMPGRLTAADLARRARLTIAELQTLNPGLTDRALRGRRPLPRGYALRVPADRQARLAAARLDTRPGWRPPVAVAARRPLQPERPGGLGAGAAAAIGAPAALARATPVAANRGPQPAAAAAGDTPALDPESYRARMMTAEETALDHLLAATDGDAGGTRCAGDETGSPEAPCAAAARADDAPEPELATATAVSGIRARPPEAAGDRLVDAAVEAAELSDAMPVETDAGAHESVVRPGRRIVPAAAPEGATFRTTVRGGETLWRLTEWSEEPIEAFRARNRLTADQPLAVGQVVSISTAKVDRETFDARRAVHHDDLRRRAAREFQVVETREHVVVQGETPWRLAEAHGIPFWLLEQANPALDLSSVRVGETLRIPIVRPASP